MKKTGIMFLIIVLIGFGNHHIAATEKIVMLGSDWPVWETVRAMHSLGRLSPKIDFLFRSYTTNIDRFKDDIADVTFLTLYDFLYTQRENENGVIISITDYSSGGDKIVVRPEVKSPADLLGKYWALQSNSISLWLAHIYLMSNGYSLNDIRIKYTKGEEVGRMLMQDSSIIAAVGWNPNFEMVSETGGKVIVTSADFPNNVFDVIVVKKDSLEKNRALYKAFLNDWFKAINDPKISEQIAKNLGVTVDQYNGWLSDAKIYKSKEEALHAYGEMRKVAEDILAFFDQDPPTSIRRGATRRMFGKEKTIDVNRLFDTSLLE
ncbi:MAG: hypothetical protein GY729_13895 [Desulfobacteraceae bacterium]|nr:hypothetical protein [Desulfobacteraceae bacterium]